MESQTYTAFAGDEMIASGSLKNMLLSTKEYLDRSGDQSVLIFADHTGKQVDFDFRGTPEDVIERLSDHPLFVENGKGPVRRSGPGRPKLGVVSREVSLLPRHWDWLGMQPQGISAALRKLVDAARKQEPDREKGRRARDAAGSFMWAMAGSLEGFEEASRALFAKDHTSLKKCIRGWPKDIKQHVLRLVRRAKKLEGDALPERA